MTSERPNDRPLVRIAFDLPDENAHDVTGYCAAEMAIEAANVQPDFPYTVELTPIVDRRDVETARRVAHAFVSDPLAVGVLGPLNSAMAVAGQDIYNAAGMVQLTSEASTPALTARGFKNFFRLVANDEHQGRALARVAVRYLHGQRIVVLHDNSAWGKPIAEIFSAEAEALSVRPVLVQGFGEQELSLNFDDMVRAAAEIQPDLVYFAIYWNKAHIIAHKLRYAGVKAVFLGSDALKPFAFLEVPSLDHVKPYHSLAGVDMRIRPSARSFFIQFAARYPMLLVAPQYAAEAYDCACLLLEALRRAGKPDRGAVLEAMQGLRTFEGAIGHIAFDRNGDVADPEIGLYQCSDGLRKYVGAVRDLVK